MRFLSHRYVECASWPVKNTSPSWCVKASTNSDSLKYLGLALPLSARPAAVKLPHALELRFFVRRISLDATMMTPGGIRSKRIDFPKKSSTLLRPSLIVMS